ncbi:MAG TPA: dihydroneopterin aldolase [Paraburkholderia sp.]|jgi:dihydroneopterin aldolase|nr:dihydroneopterin aldolase [Paraburkholderia sp.]
MTLIDPVRLSRTDGATASVLPFAFAAQETAPAVMDIVFIENLRGRTIIGIDADEQHTPQPVTMNLAIGVPSLRACETDRIEDTVNYAAVREALHALLAAHRVKLLEALAEQIAQLLIGRFGAHWVRVQIAKPARFDDVDGVGVVIERRRDASLNGCAGGYAALGAGLVPGN